MRDRNELGKRKSLAINRMKKKVLPNIRVNLEIKTAMMGMEMLAV